MGLGPLSASGSTVADAPLKNRPYGPLMPSSRRPFFDVNTGRRAEARIRTACRSSSSSSETR